MKTVSVYILGTVWKLVYPPFQIRVSLFRSSHLRCSVKEVFLEISQNAQENTCVRASLLIKLQACNFIKKETLTQVFSCEFCEIFKSNFFYRTHPGGCFSLFRGSPCYNYVNCWFDHSYTSGNTFSVTNFCNLHRNILQVVIWKITVLKGALSCLRQFVNWKPSKNDEKCFLFHLKSSFCSQDILVFVLTFWSCMKTAWIGR